jgi:hypothetical protein
VGVVEAPTPTGALIAPIGPTAPKRPLPTSSPGLQEPILDNYLTYEPNNSLQLDSIGGDIDDGSWGRHTDEDVYRVLDREQEAQRPAIGQQDGIGGDIGEGSWGRHTNEDAYGSRMESRRPRRQLAASMTTRAMLKLPNWPPALEDSP